MRQLRVIAMTVGLVTMGIFGLQAGAGAQSGYPGITVTAGGTITVVTQYVGDTFYVTACGYGNGDSITFSVPVNGVETPVGKATAGTNGCGTGVVTISDPHLSVNGGTPAPIPYGTTALEATGLSPTGGTVTDTINVPVAESSAAAAGSSSGLAFTGADIMGVVVGGLALIAMGYMILTFVRRRSTATA
jgi:hypothetical protein